MTASVLGLFNAYLAPLLLAVPIFVLLLLLGMRRGDDDATPRRRASDRAHRPPQSAGTVTAPAPVALAPAAPVAPSLPTAPPVAPTAPSAVPAAATAPAPTVVLPAPAAAPAGVLVVDDSAVVRTKLRRLLESAGYRVTLANDGSDALAALAHDSYELLITDLEMPQMDGFALIAAVQGSLETEDLPIIAITGHEELQARVHDVQGLYGLYKKPWNDRQLLVRVAALTALGRRSRPQPQTA